MNTLLIKHINDAQQKMSAYLTLLDLRYRNLCVKADPIALLPVTIDSGDKDLNIEDVANVSVPNEYQLAVFPNEFSYMKDLIRGIFDAHPEFRLEIKDMNEESKEKLNNSDEEGPDLSELGLDKLLNQDNDETKYLLYTIGLILLGASGRCIRAASGHGKDHHDAKQYTYPLFHIFNFLP